MRPTELQQFHPFAQCRHEALEQGSLDQDTLGAKADLAAVQEDGAHHAIDRRVEIAVGEHDRGIFSTEFERDRLHVNRGCFHDRRTRTRFAGERDGTDVGIGRDELSS